MARRWSPPAPARTATTLEQDVLPCFDIVACYKCGSDRTAIVGTDDDARETIHGCLLCGAELRVVIR